MIYLCCYVKEERGISMAQLGGNTFKCTVPLAFMSSVAPSRYFLLRAWANGSGIKCSL